MEKTTAIYHWFAPSPRSGAGSTAFRLKSWAGSGLCRTFRRLWCRRAAFAPSFSFDQCFAENPPPVSLNLHSSDWLQLNDAVDEAFMGTVWGGWRQVLPDSVANAARNRQVHFVPCFPIIEWMRNPTPPP